MTKKIVFDFDGTIADTKTAYCGALANAFNNKGIEISNEDVEEFLYPSISGTIADILRAMEKFDRKLVEELTQETIEDLSATHFSNIKPIDGIKELMEELIQAGSKLYLVSNSHSNFVLPALTEFQMGEYFSNVVTLDSGYNNKSESLEYVAHNAGCMMGELVYVADTMMDAQIANDLALPLIILLTEYSWDYDKKDELIEVLKGRPRIDIANDLGEAKKILLKYIEESGDRC